MLTKGATVVYHPSVPGVTGYDAYTVCTDDTPTPPPPPPPSAGGTTTVCEYQQVPIGTYTLEDYQMFRCRYDEIGTTKYVTIGPICRTVNT